MTTTKLLVRSVSALGLLAVLSGYGLTSSRSLAASNPSFRDANAATSQALSAAATEEQGLKRASRVMHTKIKSPDGKTLGRVHDVVLTPDLNGISYVAVSSGGILGIGGTLHAVPWSSLSPSLNNTYTIPVREQQWKQSRGFRPSSWPSSAESAQLTSSMSMDQQAGSRGTSIDVQNRRFTRIRGSSAKATDGRNSGRVHDMVVVTDSGRIAYTIVTYGGLAGVGTRLAAVPQSAVMLEPALHVARIDATPAALRANSFASGRWPDLANPTFARQLDQAFGTQAGAGGTALGYVPAQAQGPVAAAPAPKSKAPARSSTPPVSGTTPSTSSAAAGEPSPSDLTGTFSPSSIMAVDGTVIDEGKFNATATGPDMIWLRIRTNDGRTVLANLGPRNYVSGQDFYIVRGDRIHLTGSEVAATAAGRRVFLPTDITYNNHVLHLRSTTGTPLWEGQQSSTTSSSSLSQPPAGSSTSSTPSTSTPGTRSKSRSSTEPNEPNKP
jgi:sporulation protein YlmC with PRC-barrel domain